MNRQSACKHSQASNNNSLPFEFRSEPEGSDDQRPRQPEVAQSETVGTDQSEGISYFPSNRKSLADFLLLRIHDNIIYNGAQ